MKNHFMVPDTFSYPADCAQRPQGDEHAGVSDRDLAGQTHPEVDAQDEGQRRV